MRDRGCSDEILVESPDRVARRPERPQKLELTEFMGAKKFLQNTGMEPLMKLMNEGPDNHEPEALYQAIQSSGKSLNATPKREWTSLGEDMSVVFRSARELTIVLELI